MILPIHQEQLSLTSADMRPGRIENLERGNKTVFKLFVLFVVLILLSLLVYDYKASEVPMLPAIVGIKKTEFWIIVNTVILVFYSLIPLFVLFVVLILLSLLVYDLPPAYGIRVAGAAPSAPTDSHHYMDINVVGYQWHIYCPVY